MLKKENQSLDFAAMSTQCGVKTLHFSLKIFFVNNAG